MNKEEVIKVLREAERLGEVNDQPEGSRFIILSDTLANAMAKALEDSEE